MLEAEPQLIGKGSYGCVFEPPLKCDDDRDTSFYNGKVSKSMLNEDAIDEINSQHLLDQLDHTFTYHLPPPDKCKIQSKDEKKCVITKEGEQFDSDTLLILQDGGLSLKDFIEKIIENISILVETKREMVYNFWSQSIKLVEFLQLLHTNGVFHNDLKPENILFNTTTYDLKVIDFGLTASTVFYNNDWYFAHPPESAFICMNYLVLIKNGKSDKSTKDDKIKAEIAKILQDDFNAISETNDDKFYSLFFSNKYESFKNFRKMYSDFINYVTFGNRLRVTKYKEWFKSKYRTNFFKDKTLEEVNQCYQNTLDIYGLGVTLQYVFERTREYFEFTGVDGQYKSELSELLLRMIHPNCFERIQIDELFESYFNIIENLKQPTNIQQPPPEVIPQQQPPPEVIPQQQQPPPKVIPQQQPIFNFKRIQTLFSKQPNPRSVIPKDVKGGSKKRKPLANGSKSKNKTKVRTHKKHY